MECLFPVFTMLKRFLQLKRLYLILFVRFLLRGKLIILLFNFFSAVNDFYSYVNALNASASYSKALIFNVFKYNTAKDIKLGTDLSYIQKSWNKKKPKIWGKPVRKFCCL